MSKAQCPHSCLNISLRVATVTIKSNYFLKFVPDRSAINENKYTTSNIGKRTRTFAHRTDQTWRAQGEAIFKI